MLANSNIYTKNHSKTLFSLFLHFFRQKHGNLHVFRHKVGPKHWFLQCFSMLWHPKTSQNIAIGSVFSFASVFPLPEAYQNDLKFHFNTFLSLDTQKLSKKIRKHHQYEVSVRNRFWCHPPDPAKGDIATAILTNVIEHLVWLFAPQ